MDPIAPYRSRLASLTLAEVESPSLSKQTALAACRSLQERLRELKRDVLAELLALRDRTLKSTRGTLGSLPPERRDRAARALLKDVKERVSSMLDGKDEKAVEAFGEINREIDERLSRLAEIRHELARAVGVDRLPGATSAARPRTDEQSADDLYAAIGAAVRKGAKDGAFCSHCGQGIASGDRFCRHCGHRLRGSSGAE